MFETVTKMMSPAPIATAPPPPSPTRSTRSLDSTEDTATICTQGSDISISSSVRDVIDSMHAEQKRRMERLRGIQSKIDKIKKKRSSRKGGGSSGGGSTTSGKKSNSYHGHVYTNSFHSRGGDSCSEVARSAVSADDAALTTEGNSSSFGGEGGANNNNNIDNNNQEQEPVGIMTIRTMRESISKGKGVQLRKRRRALRVKMKRQVNDFTTSSTSSSNTAGTNSTRTAGSLDSSSTGKDFRVAFSNVTIRDYPMMPGVNPTVAEGPPLTLEWNYTEESSIPLEEYEVMRCDDRRMQVQMKVPAKIRERILYANGYTSKAVRESAKAARDGAKERAQTVALIGSIGVEKMDDVGVMNKVMKKAFKSKKDKDLEDEIFMATWMDLISDRNEMKVPFKRFQTIAEH